MRFEFGLKKETEEENNKNFVLFAYYFHSIPPLALFLCCCWAAVMSFGNNDLHLFSSGFNVFMYVKFMNESLAVTKHMKLEQ